VCSGGLSCANTILYRSYEGIGLRIGGNTASCYQQIVNLSGRLQYIFSAGLWFKFLIPSL
ncbi:MAG: hypothetical protein NUV31_06475, partial [Dehalococcoidales bacterium]|nr:hypothetical protein [Dehalococcoidales bacterium]